MNSPHSGLDRRGFLLATTTAAALTLTVGCAGTSDDTKNAAETGTPQRGGTLRAAFAGGGADETLDPHATNLFVDAARAKSLYDKLADFGTDLAPVPRLAERWEPNRTLDIWKVTLREAAFHDGHPVTAEDVLYSYRRIADPAGTFRAKASLEPIDLAASRALDATTVEFRLKRPYAEFPNVLAAFGAYIVPGNTTSFDQPVGSGPFTFGSFTPGKSLTVERNDAYWEGAPHLNRVEFIVASEESARTSALLGGQVQCAHELDPATARTYEGGGKINVIRLPGSSMQGFVMKTDRPQAANFTVRREAKLTANASPEPVAKNATLTVNGRLTRANWQTHKYDGYSGRSVKLQFRRAGTSTYTDVKTVTSGSGGALKTTVKATADGYWRWYHAATTTTSTARATGDYVDVR
ncbi:ABC transporter substrate-binding protein [Streptomyces sp. NPDC006458]|uniref:ABC transporter substrate-binding protein n=1 Tax=Streptomyces sp. NPDC006458 TaxID=3154302 RepID=UPI0033B8A0FE